MLLFVFLLARRMCLLRAAGRMPLAVPLHAALCGCHVLLFVFLPAHRMCIFRAAGRCASTRLRFVDCKPNIAQYIIIFSCVRSKLCAVYSLASATCCLVYASCCSLPAACCLLKIAAVVVDSCALLSAAWCAAAAAVLGFCHPQTVLSRETATYLA